MTTGIIHDQNLEKQIEKQMGCMAGFLQLFDRHQIITGKRLYATKRLPPSSAIDYTSESEKLVGSPAFSRELEKQQHNRPLPSPERSNPSQATELLSLSPALEIPAENQKKSPPPLAVFDFKDSTSSSWKFSREAPRLSLDSRATVDAKGSLYPRDIRTNAAILSAKRYGNTARGTATDVCDKQYRSPSVIARLMGLEPLPSSGHGAVDKVELRRSNSESRVSRDLLHFRFSDVNNFNMTQANQSNFANNVIRHNAVHDDGRANVRAVDPIEYAVRNVKAEQARIPERGFNASPWKTPQQRKSAFDSEDFFPEPKNSVSIYGEIEKRLKMRGINESAKDLETLKQILEALQLKGLLHSKKPAEIGQKNFGYDRSFLYEESPIVLMKPARSPCSLNRNGRVGNNSPPSSVRSKPGVLRNLKLAGEFSPTQSPRRERPEIDRNIRNGSRVKTSSSVRNENVTKSPNSMARRKPPSIEAQGRLNDSMEQRRVSPIHSPRLSPRSAVGSDQTTTRSPRIKKPTADSYPKEKISVLMEDELSTISECRVSTSSQADTERSKMDNCKEGNSLLERCDKLLHSIAEFTTESQPSPVSVLDSSFYKDESSSPSPVMQRSIDFEEQRLEAGEETWSQSVPSIQTISEEDSNDHDFLYISEILKAFDSFSDDNCDLFLLLEKQRYLKGNGTSKASTLERKLIFDTIAEILDEKKNLPPWKAVSWTESISSRPSVRRIWSEFRRIRERDTAEDLFEIICGILRKDLSIGGSINGWGDNPKEMSEAVLDIERQIFKDLVGATIRDFAAFEGSCRVSAPRRKLVF